MKYTVRLHRIRRSVDTATLYIEAMNDEEAQDFALEAEHSAWEELDAETESVEVVDCVLKLDQLVEGA